MFVRLVQLFMALYYGNLKRFGENNSTPEADRNPDDLDHVIGEDDGWISWAWNSVLGEDEENASDLPLDESTSSQKEAILITLGLHLRETQLVFKTGHRPSLPAAKVYLGGTGVELIGKIVP